MAGASFAPFPNYIEFNILKNRISLRAPTGSIKMKEGVLQFEGNGQPIEI
jgi:hypothetical protein